MIVWKAIALISMFASAGLGVLYLGATSEVRGLERDTSRLDSQVAGHDETLRKVVDLANNLHERLGIQATQLQALEKKPVVQSAAPVSTTYLRPSYIEADIPAPRQPIETYVQPDYGSSLRERMERDADRQREQWAREETDSRLRNIERCQQQMSWYQSFGGLKPVC